MTICFQSKQELRFLKLLLDGRRTTCEKDERLLRDLTPLLQHQIKQELKDICCQIKLCKEVCRACLFTPENDEEECEFEEDWDEHMYVFCPKVSGPHVYIFDDPSEQCNFRMEHLVSLDNQDVE